MRQVWRRIAKPIANAYSAHKFAILDIVPRRVCSHGGSIVDDLEEIAALVEKWTMFEGREDCWLPMPLTPPRLINRSGKHSDIPLTHSATTLAAPTLTLVPSRSTSLAWWRPVNPDVLVRLAKVWKHLREYVSMRHPKAVSVDASMRVKFDSHTSE